MTLKVLLLGIAMWLGRGIPSAHVADAIVTECQAEADAHPVDVQACIALVTTYASRESNYQPGVFGDGGKSFGLLQEPAAIARQLDTRGQVRWWLDTLRRGTLEGLDSSPSRAHRRSELAARLLERAQDGW